MVYGSDAAPNQLTDRRLGRKLLVGAIGEIAPFRPVADGFEVDVDKGRDERPLIAKGDGLLDVGKEFELVLDELRSEQPSALKSPNILGTVEDLELPVSIEKHGITGVDPAVRTLDLRGRFRVLVIALESARTLEQNFAVLGAAQFHIFDGCPDRVGLHLSVLLNPQEHRALGHPVKLFQVDAQGAVERE